MKDNTADNLSKGCLTRNFQRFKIGGTCGLRPEAREFQFSQLELGIPGCRAIRVKVITNIIRQVDAGCRSAHSKVVLTSQVA